MVSRQRTSRSGSIDGGERPAPPQSIDEDEMLVDDPVPVNDFSELDDDSDETPSERRRDPLRRKF